MKISVAMTTYKSTRFVKEQLESIFKQTRLPDEIIICDDASPDNTVEVIESIIRKAPKEIDIKMFVNDKNLGFVKNFENAFSKCSGDIVFPCDADDIWEPEKIKEVAKEFEKDEKVVYAFCDAIVIDAIGNVINDSLNDGWDIRKDKTDAEQLVKLMIQRKGLAYGFTSAIKKEVIDSCVPFPVGYGHDGWIGMCAPIYGKVVTLPYKLAKYRRHGSNTSGNRTSIWNRLRKWNADSWFTHPEEIQNVWSTYLERYESVISDSIKRELLEQIEFQKHLNRIVCRECWGGLKLIKFFLDGTYQKYRGTRNTLILDEVYLLLHIFR